MMMSSMRYQQHDMNQSVASMANPEANMMMFSPRNFLNPSQGIFCYSTKCLYSK